MDGVHPIKTFSGSLPEGAASKHSGQFVPGRLHVSPLAALLNGVGDLTPLAASDGVDDVGG
ncbi:hypothetical protein ABK905_23135 [Acerihabitans sp. KWT182]|uniref:Uncharacterized protein n=1 Tax=Acerihabitans sp. KWT182 TaxID=3157919 RepID=A0AAU7QHB5_9GAMM